MQSAFLIKKFYIVPKTVLHNHTDSAHTNFDVRYERRLNIMCHRTKSFEHKNEENEYDDGNIPEIDLPQDEDASVEPLPESSRPRRDGPGGD